MRSLIALSLVLLITACTTPAPQIPDIPQVPGGNQDIQGSVGIEGFSSAQELRLFLQEHETGFVGDGMLARTTMMAADMAESAPSAGGADYSGTNVQVQGVDEADILKTDGEYIYTITEDTVFIIKAYPGEDARIVSRIELDNRPQGLFIDGDRLAVFGSFNDLDYFQEHDLRPRSGMTYFDVYDVSERARPSRVHEYKFEGRYFEARMTDGWVYFVVRSMPEARPLPMPYIIEDDVVRNVPISDVYRYPIPYDAVQFTTVHAIEMDSSDLSSRTLASDMSQTLYMSPSALYFASTQRINEWEMRQEIMAEIVEPQLTRTDRDLIRKIESIDADVLSRSEKRQKIYGTYQDYVNFMTDDEREDLQDRIEETLKERLESYEALEFTVIHRMDADRGDLDIGPTGKVPGTIHNQFALDEHDGVLRVATTINPNRFIAWPMVEPAVMEDVAIAESAAEDEAITVRQAEIMPAPSRTQSSSSVYTLDEDLEVMDSVEGIAEGERIFATRFMQGRLYMVTFRQVDPFFVIDLSDPDDIGILGELKIPGFSRYLHPYDDDTIIGIGRDATSTGRQQGIKISLFDVSDVTDPDEVASWVADERYSQTSAEWEHKAFLFDRERNLLVIPAYSYEYEYRSGREQGYNGAFVFHVTGDDISLRGLIDHADSERRYGPQVERSLYIEDLLYTKSPNLLRINDLDDLHGVKDITLESDKDVPYPVY